MGLSPTAISCRRASCRSSHQKQHVRGVKAPWMGGRVCLVCPSRARAPPALQHGPVHVSPSKARKHTVRCSFSAPPGRPASSARASARCATCRTLAPPRRRCRVGAHLLAQLQQLGQLPGLVLERARQHVLLAGQLGSSRFSGPSCAAQERLHLRPGVPVARADHPVPLRVKEVDLVRELQDGAAGPARPPPAAPP